MHEPLSWVSRGAREAPGSGIFDVVNYGRDKPGLIPLWAGEGDVPTPRFIVEAAQRGLADGETFYTHQRGIPPLREALAAYYERQFARPFDPESFYVTGSGMQAILICLQLTTGAGEEVLIPTPTWPNVAGAAIVKGATPVEVHMREESGAWTLEIEDLEAATTPMTRAIFVNSPANPSGWVASRETLQEILLFARRHRLWIIADEIYSRFVYDGTARAPSFLDIAEPQDRVVYVNTFSKNWAMTGWRMGWIHAPVALRQTLENLIHYSTCGVAQFMQQAGVVALNEGEWYIEHTVERARVGRKIVSKEFQHHNRVIYTEPAGAFYSFFRVEGLENAKETAFRLIDEAAVGTAPGDAFGSNGDGFVRICFARSPESLGDAMARIGRFLGS